MEKNSGKTVNKIFAACLLGLAALIMGICIGSVSISLPDTLNIIGAKLFGVIKLFEGLPNILRV
jgi:iron complex transport system permease protein